MLLKVQGKLRWKAETELVEMANLRPQLTGFSHYIWVGPPDPRHGHRVKVVNEPGRIDPGDSFSLSISDNPEVVSGKCKIDGKELQAIKEWIVRNAEALLRHARMEIDDDELKSTIK